MPVSFSAVMFALFCSLAPRLVAPAQAAPPSASMAVATNKSVYYPGEVVTLRVTLSPKAAEGMVMYPNVSAGTLDVFVSFQKERFRAYLGPGWGLTDAIVRPVKTTQSRPLVIETDLFYQVRLTDFDEPRATYLKEGFVFQRPGTYRIKAVLHDASGDVESPPTTISVKPLKDAGSLAIWREISNADDFGYLVHGGSLPGRARPAGETRGGPDGEVTRRLLDQISSLMTRYPNSPLVATLKRAQDANQAARENLSHRLERVISRPDP